MEEKSPGTSNPRVKNGNNGEACPVCLDVPSVGETCIDAWLKRKPTCPVCKSKVAF
ncbi:hypothetical protein KSP40_PGU001172 [Platanthera guangdongensis]|uniref:RING-type domain-containing protein n=1 Tax=Platanthera guangdongensis TaxID=2320717 RepID=A0ABR2MEM4_9ASPA